MSTDWSACPTAFSRLVDSCLRGDRVSLVVACELLMSGQLRQDEFSELADALDFWLIWSYEMSYALRSKKYSWWVVSPPETGRVLVLAFNTLVVARVCCSVTCRPVEPMLVARASILNAPSWGTLVVSCEAMVLGQGVTADDLRDRRSGSWVKPAVDSEGRLTVEVENVTDGAFTLRGCWWGYPFGAMVGPYSKNEALDRYGYLRARGEEVFVYPRSEGLETVARGKLPLDWTSAGGES